MQPKNPLFTSGSQHPPRFGPAVYLGDIVITLSVRPSVSPSIPLRVRCISPIFFEIGVPNFSVWIHLGMAECRVSFSGYCDIDLDL